MTRGAAPVLLASLIAAGSLASGCVTADESAPVQAQQSDVTELNGFGEPLIFDAACEPGERITVAAVGDVLLHGRLQRQAYESEDGFVSLWSGVADLLASADVTYANLEGPTAPGVNSQGKDVADPGKVFDDYVYSSYPMFNYHPSLLDDLIDTGVDVVSTANNHSLDRRALGADRTIDELRGRDLAFTGTRKQGEDAPWFAVTETEGFRLAWLACTYGTNGIPDPHHQVLGCFAQRDEVLGLIEELSDRTDIDAVIVTPHWGAEYQPHPNAGQVDLARDMLDHGALAVIGSHPHVLQPWERHVTPDGRETFAIYSLGNFVSGQTQLPRRSTLALFLGLTRGADGETRINGARYVPLHMTRDSTMHLDVIDSVGGHGDSRALTVDMFDLWNLALPTPTIETSPQCSAQWVEPHPHDGWIGGTCSSDQVCGGTLCEPTLPGGSCTLPCDGLCPDQAGRPTTFCVAAPDGLGGICVPRCVDDADCRIGYRCEERDRFASAELADQSHVCVPEGSSTL